MLALACRRAHHRARIERSRLGYGFATIRDDELAAEASGVPTLRLKLIATTISGALDGHGRRAVSLLHRLPRAGLGLRPRICGELHRHADDRRHHQLGRPADRRDPARALQQIATVTISSAVNLLIVGVLLVAFVIMRRTASSAWCRIGIAQEGEVSRACSRSAGVEQALRRLRRARRHRLDVARASGSA